MNTIPNQQIFELEIDNFKAEFRSPTFPEFEDAFSKSFKSMSFDMDFFTFIETLIPICFIHGDKIVVEDEELRYYAGEQLKEEFLRLYFFRINEEFETVENTEYLTYEYEGKKAYLTKLDFRDIRYVKNSLAQGIDFIGVLKQIFLEKLNKSLSNMDFLTNHLLLFNSAFLLISHLKVKQAIIKKK